MGDQELIDSCFLGCGERALFREDGYCNSILVQVAGSDYDEVAGNVLRSHSLQSVHCHGDNPQSLTRFTKLPASNRDNPVGFQVLKIFFKCLRGIEIILAQGESAGSGRGPRVDQGHLYDIESVLTAAQERTAVANMQVDVRTLVKMASEVRITATHDGVSDGGINFDSGDAIASIGECPKNINS